MKIMDDTKLRWIEEMNDRERAALVNRLQLEMFRPVSEYEWPINVDEIREEIERDAEFNRCQAKEAKVKRSRQLRVRGRDQLNPLTKATLSDGAGENLRKAQVRVALFTPMAPRAKPSGMVFEKLTVSDDARDRAAEAI